MGQGRPFVHCGVIGMRLAAENPGLVNRMVVSNMGLPDRDPAEPLPESIEATGPFADFQRMAREAPVWEPLTLLPMVMVAEPGAADQPHVILEGGGHFLQEDIPVAYNEALLSWLGPAS